MAALDFSYRVSVAVTDPVTLCQFKAPTNQRVKVKAIEVMPQGSTGASAPLLFDVCLQDDAGTSADDSSGLVKQAPVADETIQTTVRKSFTVEPTTSTEKHNFSLHQQSARTWVPPDGPIVIEGNTRLGVRYQSTADLTVDIAVYLEE